MKDGKLVEAGSVHQVFNSPQQEYTQALLNAIPGKSLLNRDNLHRAEDTKPVAE
jgi:ABC-type oligopeptide transport system ATPase subunit